MRFGLRVSAWQTIGRAHRANYVLLFYTDIRLRLPIRHRMPNESIRLSRKTAAISFTLTVLIIALGSTAYGEPIYYAVSQGQNFDKQTWHSGDSKAFNANRPENVFDFYTFHRLSDGTAKVIREFNTPSGDWFLNLTYFYGKDGRLGRIDFDFRTFNGICPCGETGPVRCQRSYTVDKRGRLRKESEMIIELKSGNAVDWKFYEPKVRHWAKLSHLPIKPR